MSKAWPQVVILVEDKQQQSFVRRLLKGLGIPNHKLRVLPVPAGAQAGEQYVRENFPREVREHRKRRHKVAALLAVMTDADTLPVAQHRALLMDNLARSGQQPLEADEAVLVLIPKRNIETWIHYLSGKGVPNEEDKYPRLTGRGRECQQAVERLAALLQQSKAQPDDCPESLRLGIEILRRHF